MIDTIYIHNLCSYFHLSKNHHNHCEANNGLHNVILTLPDTKPRKFKGSCHPAILLVYSSVYSNKNEGVRCVCVREGGVGRLIQGLKQSEPIVNNLPFQ